MKYEVILKCKVNPSSSFEQFGRIVVPREHLVVQEHAYQARALRLGVFEYVILINEIKDDGEFVRVIR